MESCSAVKINYNKNIYKKSIVSDALQEYAVYLKGEIVENNSYITVIFNNAGEESADDFEEIIDEFSNFVLEASISI